MSRYAEVLIVVEGQTEHTFIRDVLEPEMRSKNICLQPVLIGAPGHKGGDVRFDRAKDDIEKLLRPQRQDTYVSTMFDYFRIERTWPGREEVGRRLESGVRLSSADKARIMEEATLAEIKNCFGSYDVGERLIPYISMHEFEALLFSDASILASHIGVNQREIDKILTECGEPEDINDRVERAPSKRLSGLCNYLKITMGRVISGSIGIGNIRKKCPHFDEWLVKMERLVG